ncbi:hypothetical protein P3342_002197 [Pyrenophora teres f. teres]|nr:hypothetical protein P3342_002197 [Pyrenophora teres f. teres]
MGPSRKERMMVLGMLFAGLCSLLPLCSLDWQVRALTTENQEENRRYIALVLLRLACSCTVGPWLPVILGQCMPSALRLRLSIVSVPQHRWSWWLDTCVRLQRKEYRKDNLLHHTLPSNKYTPSMSDRLGAGFLMVHNCNLLQSELKRTLPPSEHVNRRIKHARDIVHKSILRDPTPYAKNMRELASQLSLNEGDEAWLSDVARCPVADISLLQCSWFSHNASNLENGPACTFAYHSAERHLCSCGCSQETDASWSQAKRPSRSTNLSRYMRISNSKHMHKSAVLESFSSQSPLPRNMGQ